MWRRLGRDDGIALIVALMAIVVGRRDAHRLKAQLAACDPRFDGRDGHLTIDAAVASDRNQAANDFSLVTSGIALG